MKRKIVSFIVLLCFITSTFLPYANATQVSLPMPPPGQLLPLSQPASCMLLKGLRINPKDPLKLEFIIDAPKGKALDKKEFQRLVSYFMAAIAVPEKDFWVNLSPYEKNRVMPDTIASTDFGRDLLLQDYILKQVASSMTYPETALGKQYWRRLSQEAEKNGAKIDFKDALSKVWIVPDTVEVLENNNIAVINNMDIDVLTEQDYNSSKGYSDNNVPVDMNIRVIKELLLPQLRKEVNTGANFIKLRQMFYSYSLALWFKAKLKDSLFKYYIDSGNVKGIDLKDNTIKERVYSQYLSAFQKGAYDYVKKERVLNNRKISSRRYFSGGITPEPDNLVSKASSVSVIALAVLNSFLGIVQVGCSRYGEPGTYTDNTVVAGDAGTAGDGEDAIGNGGKVSTTGGSQNKGGTSSRGGSSSMAGEAGASGENNNQAGADGQGGANTQGGSNNRGGANNQGGTDNQGGVNSRGGADTQGGTNNQGGTNTRGGASSQGGANNQGGTNNQGGANTQGGTNTQGGVDTQGGANNQGGSNISGDANGGQGGVAGAEVAGAAGTAGTNWSNPCSTYFSENGDNNYMADMVVADEASYAYGEMLAGIVDAVPYGGTDTYIPEAFWKSSLVSYDSIAWLLEETAKAKLSAWQTAEILKAVIDSGVNYTYAAGAAALVISRAGYDYVSVLDSAINDWVALSTEAVYAVPSVAAEHKDYYARLFARWCVKNNITISDLKTQNPAVFSAADIDSYLKNLALAKIKAVLNVDDTTAQSLFDTATAAVQEDPENGATLAADYMGVADTAIVGYLMTSYDTEGNYSSLDAPVIVDYDHNSFMSGVEYPFTIRDVYPASFDSSYVPNYDFSYPVITLVEQGHAASGLSRRAQRYDAATIAAQATALETQRQQWWNEAMNPSTLRPRNIDAFTYRSSDGKNVIVPGRTIQRVEKVFKGAIAQERAARKVAGDPLTDDMFVYQNQLLKMSDEQQDQEDMHEYFEQYGEVLLTTKGLGFRTPQMYKNDPARLYRDKHIVASILMAVFMKGKLTVSQMEDALSMADREEDRSYHNGIARDLLDDTGYQYYLDNQEAFRTYGGIDLTKTKVTSKVIRPIKITVSKEMIDRFKNASVYSFDVLSLGGQFKL